MGWQDVAAIGVVFGAVFYLSSLGWKGLIGGKSSGCGSCGKCSTSVGRSGGGGVDARAEQLVTIGPSHNAPRAQAAAGSVDQSQSS